MSASHDQFLELCAGEALGALGAADRRALAAHLAECEACRAAMAAFRESALDVARSTEPVSPPPAVESRVLDAIRRSAPAPTPATRSRAALYVGVGALVAATALLTIGYFRLRAELDEQAQEAARLRQAVQEQVVRDGILDAKAALFVTLAGTPDADAAGMSAASVRVIYDPDSDRAILRTRGLRPLAGRSFELWAIYDTGPKSLGLVRVDEAGEATQVIEQIGGRAGLNAFGISNEVEGGSPDKSAPQGKVGLAGAI